MQRMLCYFITYITSGNINIRNTPPHTYYKSLAYPVYLPFSFLNESSNWFSKGHMIFRPCHKVIETSLAFKMTKEKDIRMSCLITLRTCSEGYCLLDHLGYETYSFFFNNTSPLTWLISPSLGGAVAQWVEVGTSSEEVLGLIPAVAARSLLVGLV